MQVKWLSAALVAAVLTVPAFGQISVYIGSAPPPLRYEVRPAYPGDGYQWVDGYWGINNRHYLWTPGRWDRPPYAGGYWSHPHYDHYKQGWRMQEGYWGHEDHRDHRDDRRDHRDDHHDNHDQGHGHGHERDH